MAEFDTQHTSWNADRNHKKNLTKRQLLSTPRIKPGSFQTQSRSATHSI